MDIDDLKKKLRQLKKFENRTRFGGQEPFAPTVWETFFNAKHPDDQRVKYSLNRLAQMDKAQLKAVVDEFFFSVYYQAGKENGYSFDNVYDPEMLRLLELSPYASKADVKSRFRELAKLYHPDQGGDAGKMVELLDIYKGIIKDGR
jgi:DnaJ-domain-containing protein 1